VKDLEEEKKNLEKKVIDKFKGFSKTFASQNTLKQVQNEQIRQTLEQEIKTMLAVSVSNTLLPCSQGES
jgi:ribosome-associated toxin RatA of RatAB toxin-antitoxin module